MATNEEAQSSGTSLATVVAGGIIGLILLLIAALNFMAAPYTSSSRLALAGGAFLLAIIAIGYPVYGRYIR